MMRFGWAWWYMHLGGRGSTSKTTRKTCLREGEEHQLFSFSSLKQYFPFRFKSTALSQSLTKATETLFCLGEIALLGNLRPEEYMSEIKLRYK